MKSAKLPVDSQNQASLRKIKSTLRNLQKAVSWSPECYRQMEASEDVTRDSPCHPPWKICTSEEFPFLNNVGFKIHSLETLLNVQAYGCYL